MRLKVLFTFVTIAFGVVLVVSSARLELIRANLPNVHVVLMINIEIPPTEKRLERGWIGGVLEEFARRPLPAGTLNASSHPRICGFATFPTHDCAEYHYYSWRFQRENGSYTDSIGVMTKKIQAIVKNKGEAIAKVTNDGPLCFNRRFYDYRCHWWIRQGNVELPIYIRKYTNHTSTITQWYGMVKTEVISRFEKANETIGMVFVTSHFSGISGARRVVIYDLDRPHDPVFKREFEGLFMRNEFIKVVNQIHKRVRNWTLSCPQTRYKDRCYFFTPQQTQCVLRIIFAGAPNQSMETVKYCPRNASGYGKRPECTSDKCQETCDQFTRWTACNSTCGGYRSLKLASNPAASPYMLSVLLLYCPGISKRINGTLQWHSAIQQCANDCAWIKGLIAFGIVVLVLVVAGGAMTVFCMFKTNVASDPQSPGRVLNMKKSAKHPSMAPIDGKMEKSAKHPPVAPIAGKA